MIQRIYRVLERPAVYRLSQALLAPGATRRLGRLGADVFAGTRGPVLDVGCGPRPTTQIPEGAQAVGVDVNHDYLRGYREAGRHAVRASAGCLPFVDAAFGEARCWGLLHHLPPELAAQSVAELARCVRPGGRVVVMDNVWPRTAWTRPLAWLTRRLDRGEWIRSEEELRQLVEAAAPGDWGSRRLTYSYNGLEAVVLIRAVE